MTDDVVARARGALEGITEGPWIAEFSGEQGNCVIPHDAESTREAVAITRLYCQTADAEFIAAARELVPELVAEVERLRAIRLVPAEPVDFYSLEDVCRIRAEYEAEVEKLRASIASIRDIANLRATGARIRDEFSSERGYLDILAVIERTEAQS